MATANLLDRNIIVMDPNRVDDNGNVISLKKFAREVVTEAQTLQPGDEIVFSIYSERVQGQTNPITGKQLYSGDWLTMALRNALPKEQWLTRYEFIRRTDGYYSHHNFRIVPVVEGLHSKEDLSSIDLF